MAAAMVGITLSSTFVGANLAISYLAVPSLLLAKPSKSATDPSPKAATSSPQLAMQWRYIYDHAMPVAITGSVISSASFIYAAVQVPRSNSMQRNLFFAAASMAVFVVPYTLALMNPTNSVLMERAKTGDAMNEIGEGDVTEVGMPKAQGLNGYRTDQLLNRWAMLNYGRATIPIVGIFCAIAALLQ
jgi:hypothetical protein